MVLAKAAIVFEKNGNFSIAPIEIEPPTDNEILVRNVGCGICAGDLIIPEQIYPIPLPMVGGHEGSGIVEKIGRNVSNIAVGDHIVMSFGSCGKCDSCNQGQPTYCSNYFDLNFMGKRTAGNNAYSFDGKNLNGHYFQQSSFATYSLAHERNAVKVSKDVPLEILGPLGCGVQTGAGGVLNVLRPESGSSIAVFGAGSVGLSAVMAANSINCSEIIVVDIVPERLNLAKELGATKTINGKELDAVDEIKKYTSEMGVDYTIESTGNPKVLSQAIKSLGKKGVCGIIGAPPLDAEVGIDVNDVLNNGKTIVGIVEGHSVPQVFVPALIDMYLNGKFPFDKLISYYDFKEINKAIEDMKSDKAIKPIIKIASV